MGAAPDATPFVSLYANGRLCGCYGSEEGTPGERLTRAFLRAAHDGRFAEASAAEREVLAARISYLRHPRLLNPETAAREIEIGTHGVALVRGRAPATIVLPHVACDANLGAAELLAVLLRKARTDADAWRDGGLYAFETEDVIVRSRSDAKLAGMGIDAAARWLESLIDADGAVTFAIDPRRRRRVAFGPMHHGRAAVVVQALAAAARPAIATRARRRLESDVRRALAGASVEGWPSEPEQVASTLALAVLAGVPLVRELAAVVSAEGAPKTPWYAAQVVAALGPAAPSELWDACIADLDRHPFAPWTLIAAAMRGDASVRRRAAHGVAGALRTEAPHRGGTSIAPIPETALTAIAVEALARESGPSVRAAVRRGQAFLARMQLTGERISAALEPRLAHGAFMASPVVDVLRGDVTAHAVLAGVASRAARG